MSGAVVNRESKTVNISLIFALYGLFKAYPKTQRDGSFVLTKQEKHAMIPVGGEEICQELCGKEAKLEFIMSY